MNWLSKAIVEADLEEPLSENDLVDLDLFDLVDLENEQSTEAVSVCSKDDFTDEGINSPPPSDISFVSHPLKSKYPTQMDINHGYPSSPLQFLEMSDCSDVYETENTTSPLLQEEIDEPNWLSAWDSLY